MAMLGGSRLQWTAAGYLPSFRLFIQSTMAYQELPAEIKFNIASYCTPSTLCSLALVASGLQPQAEQMLYSAIAFNAFNQIEALQRAFESITTNPQKAQYVRFLAVEAMMTHIPADKMIAFTNINIAAKSILSILPKLTSLTDLRLKFEPAMSMYLGRENEVNSLAK
ncbi:hypothetical protein H0H92_002785 [Tricholoma furcatifolium]|nr:hypothetical protein H0H92_002785 [Tricholoma furcatifolium]